MNQKSLSKNKPPKKCIHGVPYLKEIGSNNLWTFCKECKPAPSTDVEGDWEGKTGIYGQTSDGVWHKALTNDDWGKTFKYDHQTMRLKRLSTGRGFDKYINCTDKWIKSFIQSEKQKSFQEGRESGVVELAEQILLAYKFIPSFSNRQLLEEMLVSNLNKLGVFSQKLQMLKEEK